MSMDGSMIKQEHIDEKHSMYASESSSSSGSSTTSSVTGMVRKLDTTTTKVGGQSIPTTPLSSGSSSTDPLAKRRASGIDSPSRATNHANEFDGKMDQNRESISGASLSKIFDVYMWQPTDMIPPSTIVAAETMTMSHISSPTFEMNLYEKPERYSMGSSGKGMDVDDNKQEQGNPMFPNQESFMDELMVIEDVAA